MKRYVVGIDVGGTNVKLGLVDSRGCIRAKTHLSTKSYRRDKNQLIQALLKATDALLGNAGLKKKNILGIGIGLPGLINSQKGIVEFLPNIPGWKRVPLKRIIQNKTKIPTFIDNDVNIITLGEWKFGAGCGYENLVCVTLGTGVGGGLILNNALYRGEGFVAGEIGHVPLNEQGPDCDCGGFGCFEQYVGNQQILSRARQIFGNKNLQLQDIDRLAEKGQRQAKAFWDEIATHIGNGLISVVNVLNPRLIIMGGGVSNAYPFMRKTILDVIKKRAMKVQSRMVKITRAKLGNDAGIIGAEVLIRSSTL